MALNYVRPTITDDVTAALNADGQNIIDLDARMTSVEQSIQGAIFGNPPGAPTSLVVNPGTGTVTVSCTPPANIGNSAIRAILYVLLPLGLSAQGKADGSSVTFQQVPSVDQFGQTITYSVQASAENAGGYGANSTPSGSFTVASPTTSASAPAVMPAPSASAGTSGQAFVNFPPDTADGGSPVTLYRVVASDGTVQTGTTSPITLSGLAASGSGTPYTFRVQAQNAIDWSPLSDPSNQVTVLPIFSNPDPPQGTPTVAVSGTTATVSFIAPTNTGNSPISQYTTILTPVSGTGGSTVSVQSTTSPAVLPGLVTGVTYSGVVTDSNAAGYPSGNSASFSVTIGTAAIGTNLLPHGADNTSGGQAAFRVVLLPGGTGALPGIAGSSGSFGSTNLFMRTTAASTNPYAVGPRALVRLGAAASPLSGLLRVRTSVSANVSLRIDWVVGGEGGSSVNPLSIASFTDSTTVTTAAGVDQVLALSTTVPSGATYALIQANLLSTPAIGDTMDIGELEIATGTVTSWTVGTGSHELVTNPSAATDATNASVAASTTSLAITRISALTAPPDGFAGSTAFHITRAVNGTDTYAHANLNLTGPSTIAVGSKVVVSAWIRAQLPAGVTTLSPFAVGMLVADVNDANQISSDATYPYLVDTNWHRWSYATTATTAGVTADTFFLVLPLTGVFALDITNITVATT